MVIGVGVAIEAGRKDDTPVSANAGVRLLHR